MQTQQELDRLAVARSLKLDNYSDIEKNQDRLDKIAAYARAKGAKTTDEIIAELAALKTLVGGRDPNIHEITPYVHLALERMSAEGQEKAIEEQKALLAQKKLMIDEQMKKFETRIRRAPDGKFIWNHPL